eukprot:11213091-Lingulodinium_polyedra.AAC.1
MQEPVQRPTAPTGAGAEAGGALAAPGPCGLQAWAGAGGQDAPYAGGPAQEPSPEPAPPPFVGPPARNPAALGPSPPQYKAPPP